MARIPFADSVLVRLPEEITDEDAILCSDVFPTGYVGAHMADIEEGDIVAIFGCGPVGQMAIANAKILGAKRIIAVDVIPDRLVEAENQGALAINYDQVDPVKELKSLSNGFGPDVVIDAVGVDAQRAHSGPAAKRSLTGAVDRSCHRSKSRRSPISDVW